MKKRIIFLLTLAAIITVVVFLFISVPDLSVEKITDVKQTFTMLDKDGNVSAQITAGENRIKTTLDKVSPDVINALIATEDARFYSHHGIDVKRIFGAAWKDLITLSKKEGASTITQQLIKNSHLSSEKTFFRKISEAILSLQIEQKYSKDEILEMYLNLVYFGRGAYGIETAAQTYFGKSADKLSLAESATLVGALKAPGRYAPHIDRDASLSRRKVVLAQMEKYGFISENEKQSAENEELAIIEKHETGDYGYYTDYVLEEAAKNLDITVDDLLAGGYTVYTALDSDIQENLQNIYENDANFPFDNIQGACTVVDNTDGSVCALVGGREHAAMRIYNRATSNRQVGSCIKPLLVYGPAIESKNYTAATILEDYRKDFDDYSPTNFKDVYYGKITLRRALALSLNVPAVQIFNDLGIENCKKYLLDMGFEFDETDKHLALALGGMKYGFSTTDMASAYSVFPNNGDYINKWCIKKIELNGKEVFRNFPEKVNVFSESTAYIITSILQDVSKTNALKKCSCQTACKTGTVGFGDNGYSDAWCCGYSQKYSAAVWIGFDKTTNENYIPIKYTGSTYPADILYQVLEFADTKNKSEDFQKPDSVIKETIDAYTLNTTGEILCATEQTESKYRLDEFFAVDNAPLNESKYWEKPELPENIEIYFNEVRNSCISFLAKNDYCDYLVYKINKSGDELIGKVSGKAGQKLTVIDENYKYNDRYYVISVHKNLFDGVDKKKSEKSAEIYIN